MNSSYPQPGLIRTILRDTAKLLVLGAILVTALYHLPELNQLLDGTWPW
jgi:hypothetical protein